MSPTVGFFANSFSTQSLISSASGTRFSPPEISKSNALRNSLSTGSTTVRDFPLDSENESASADRSLYELTIRVFRLSIRCSQRRYIYVGISYRRVLIAIPQQSTHVTFQPLLPAALSQFLPSVARYKKRTILFKKFSVIHHCSAPAVTPQNSRQSTMQ